MHTDPQVQTRDGWRAWVHFQMEDRHVKKGAVRQYSAEEIKFTKIISVSSHNYEISNKGSTWLYYNYHSHGNWQRVYL